MNNLLSYETKSPVIEVLIAVGTYVVLMKGAKISKKLVRSIRTAK